MDYIGDRNMTLGNRRHDSWYKSILRIILIQRNIVLAVVWRWFQDSGIGNLGPVFYYI